MDFFAVVIHSLPGCLLKHIKASYCSHFQSVYLFHWVVRFNTWPAPNVYLDVINIFFQSSIWNIRISFSFYIQRPFKVFLIQFLKRYPCFTGRRCVSRAVLNIEVFITQTFKRLSLTTLNFHWQLLCAILEELILEQGTLLSPSSQHPNTRKDVWIWYRFLGSFYKGLSACLK